MKFSVPGQAGELYETLKSSISALNANGKISYVSNLEYQDQQCSIVASGTGFKAKIVCQDNAIQVDLELGLLMKAMKGTIEDQLSKMVKKIFQA